MGGGIGGLAAAISVRRAGHEVRVFERTSELREIGAGMTLWPNAVRVLAELQLLEEVRATAHVFETSSVGDYSGRVWTQMPMGEVGRRAGHPTLLVARGALHQILAHHARATLGASAIETSREAARLIQEAGRVELTFAGGTSVTSDAVVGADGVASVVRRELFGVSPTRFHGRTSFRSLCVDDGLSDGVADFAERHGAEGRFAFYRVGEGRVAWYANVLRRVAPHEEPHALLADVFGRWAPPVPQIIAQSKTSTIHVTPISDIDPLTAWTIGRATLLGDAAHPMTPDLGQRAGQALEDAHELGTALRSGGDLAASFSAYERARRTRATSIVLGSRSTGRIANFRGSIGLLARRALWSLLPPRVALDRMTAVVTGGMGPAGAEPASEARGES